MILRLLAAVTWQHHTELAPDECVPYCEESASLDLPLKAEIALTQQDGAKGARPSGVQVAASPPLCNDY